MKIYSIQDEWIFPDIIKASAKELYEGHTLSPYFTHLKYYFNSEGLNNLSPVIYYLCLCITLLLRQL